MWPAEILYLKSQTKTSMSRKGNVRLPRKRCQGWAYQTYQTRLSVWDLVYGSGESTILRHAFFVTFVMIQMSQSILWQPLMAQTTVPPTVCHTINFIMRYVMETLLLYFPSTCEALNFIIPSPEKKVINLLKSKFLYHMSGVNNF